MHVVENYYSRLKYTTNQKPPLPPRLLLHLDLLGLFLILKIKIQESATARARSSKLAASAPNATRNTNQPSDDHWPTLTKNFTLLRGSLHWWARRSSNHFANTTSDHHTNQNKARAPTHNHDRPISRTRENAAFEHWAPKGQHNPKEQASSDGPVFFLQALSTRAKCPLGPLNCTRTDPGHSSRHSRSVKISSSPDYGHSIWRPKSKLPCSKTPLLLQIPLNRIVNYDHTFTEFVYSRHTIFSYLMIDVSFNLRWGTNVFA